MFAEIRAFFAARGVLEVDTPHLSAAGNTDPSLANFRLTCGGRDCFLASSPEFAMKRLLAAGLGDIYQLAHVFREAELGSHHNPEFMLLEWYRTRFELTELMDEVVELVRSVGDGRWQSCPVEAVEYRELFHRTLCIDPIRASLAELRECAHRLDPAAPTLADERDVWLDWLMGAHVQPAMAPATLTLVSRYPASQAALAQLHEDRITAERFELFYGSLELANGYRELTDASEQRARFAAELATRRARGQDEPPLDERLLAALPQLPPCCGVALGVDRLVMLLRGEQRLQDVLSFAAHNA